MYTNNQLVNIHMLKYRTLCKCYNILVVTIDIGFEKVAGVVFETWIICH